MLPRTKRHPPHHGHHSTSRRPTASQTAAARPTLTRTAVRPCAVVLPGSTTHHLEPVGEVAGEVPQAPVPGQAGKERA